MKKRYKALVASGLLFLGGATGYAASTIFGDLDNIRTNFDIVLNLANTNKQTVDQLQAELDRNTSDKSNLEREIANLKNEIEQLKQNHGVEITDKNAEITRKQEELNQKQAEVNSKQDVINDLTNQLSSTRSQLEDAENAARALSQYTDQKVSEITE